MSCPVYSPKQTCRSASVRLASYYGHRALALVLCFWATLLTVILGDHKFCRICVGIRAAGWLRLVCGILATTDTPDEEGVMIAAEHISRNLNLRNEGFLCNNRNSRPCVVSELRVLDSNVVTCCSSVSGSMSIPALGGAMGIFED